MSQALYVGVDIGGTTVKVGICNAEGKLLRTYEGPTGTESGNDVILDNIAAYVRRIVDDYNASWDDVAGVGVGIPGFMDFETGVVIFSANFPSMRNVPVKAILEQKLGKPVKINNDANVAALGEAWSGAGRGLQNVVVYTLGTGVGGGIIARGKIYEGFSGMAGELGHVQVVPDMEAIQCGCGQHGCVETVSSATGIIRMAKDAVERGDKTSLADLPSIAAKDVFDAAKAGDEVALRIVKRAAFYLGKAMAATAVIVNPERFILGGGVAKAGDILFDAVREVFAKYTPQRAIVDIVPAELGNDAGVVGAAGLHLRAL
ncbi:ROK family glucokinase [Paenibacillus antri]|uniref:Glucokinase n=1 Tax=Paenibacillus antri TaxID=2582848 RepID=A0A5R9GD84_9BACL|nr:ROK family glucokinase [Paenibacillus antri]TLS49345.1 ROK family glucokinase [Paenibacillus antri]